MKEEKSQDPEKVTTVYFKLQPEPLGQNHEVIINYRTEDGRCRNVVKNIIISNLREEKPGNRNDSNVATLEETYTTIYIFK